MPLRANKEKTLPKPHTFKLLVKYLLKSRGYRKAKIPHSAFNPTCGENKVLYCQKIYKFNF